MKTKNNNLQLLLFETKTKNWYRYFIFTIKLFFLLILLFLILVVLFKLFDFMLDNNRINPFPFLGLGKVYAANGNDNDDKSKDKGKNSEGIFSKIWSGIRWILSPILGKTYKERMKEEKKEDETLKNTNSNPIPPFHEEEVENDNLEKEKKKNIFSKTWGWIKSWFIKSSTSENKDNKDKEDTDSQKDKDTYTSSKPKSYSDKARKKEKIAQYNKDNKDDQIIEQREIEYFGKSWEIESKFKLELSTLHKDLRNFFSSYILYNQLTGDEFMVVEQNELIEKIETFIETCKKNHLSDEIIVNRIKYMMSNMFVNKTLNLENLRASCVIFYRIQFSHKYYNVNANIIDNKENFFSGYSPKGYENYLYRVKHMNAAEIKEANFRFYNLIHLYFDDTNLMSSEKAKARLLARWSWFVKINAFSYSDLNLNEMSQYDSLKMLDPKFEKFFIAKKNKYQLTPKEINQCIRMFLNIYEQNKSIKRSFSQDELTDLDKIAEYERIFDVD